MALQGEYAPSSWQWVRDQVAAYEASDGREASTLRGSDDPIVVVTSVGVRSGKLRKNPVMRIERDGTYAAIASKGGADEDPTWVANLLAHPQADLQDGAEVRTCAVRLAQGAERADWWAHAVATWPTYAEYQKKTEREIPVFLLEPIDPA